MQRVLTERSERQGDIEDFRHPCWKTATEFGKQELCSTLRASLLQIDLLQEKICRGTSGGLGFGLDQMMERN